MLLHLAMVLALLFAFTSGCVVYEPVPAYSPTPSAFDRSWGAAVGAAEDVGVRIASADRTSGIIRGTKDALDVTVAVGTQADGRVRVEFNAKGPAGQDAPLVERMSRAYDRRMGR